ncbi:MAG: fused MFS/spermidine synthase [Deltaproteobacteria bacterium]|nr:fused MFS/spermidine synthase [Deltaproteobacteria bacterium]
MPEPHASPAPPPRRLLFSAFAASGAAALVYEVVWTRALSLVVGSTTFALSTMLASFMGGLAVGGWLGGRWADRSAAPWRVFGFCELGIGLAGVLSIPLIYELPGTYIALYRAFHAYPAIFFPFQILLCAVVMLLPTILMGATFPLVSRSVTRGIGEVGRSVGRAYSFNNIGAVTGALVAGFLLIPSLGVRGASWTAAGLNLAVGLLLVLGGRRGARTYVGSLWVVALYAPALAWSQSVETVPSLVNFYSAPRFLGVGDALMFAGRVNDAPALLSMEESGEGTVSAYRTRSGRFLLQVGGKVEGTGEGDVANALLLGFLPAALRPDAERALVIGLGAGVTLDATRRTVGEVHLAEINAGVLRAVERFGEAGALDGVSVHRNDARNMLLRTSLRFDVITSEPSYPADGAVGNLFTKEFFAIAALRLNPEGVMCQWLPYHIMTNDDVSMMVKTFVSVFPHAQLWKVPRSLDLILVGSRAPIDVPVEEIRRRVAAFNAGGPSLDYELSRGPRQLAEVAASPDVLVNTDDLPHLEFRVAHNLLAGDLAALERGANR